MAGRGLLLLNVYVADASAFPSCSGANPMPSVGFGFRCWPCSSRPSSCRPWVQWWPPTRWRGSWPPGSRPSGVSGW